ncbi:MAG: DUF4381 family protein [Pseudomonadales bacterium]
MAASELQQLRDIHLPEPPGPWPPAPGWWLLAALLLAALGRLAWRLYARHRRGRPLRYARTLYADIHRRYQAGAIDAREYLDETNELLKRVLIHGLGERQARRATGTRWLQLLDQHLEVPAFSRGPGQALGNGRFQPVASADPEQVHPVVERLLSRLAAPGNARAGPR